MASRAPKPISNKEKQSKAMQIKADNSKLEQALNEYDEKIGVTYFEGSVDAVGYLGNIKPYKIKDMESGNEFTCALLYFINEQGNWFKGCFIYNPYFFIKVKEEFANDIVLYLHKKFESMLYNVDQVEKVDLKVPNHLSGKKQKFLKLSFKTIDDLVFVRSQLRVIVEKNQTKSKSEFSGYYNFEKSEGFNDYMEGLLDIKEDDVPYHIRVCIDKEIRCSFWYKIKLEGKKILDMEVIKSKVDKADLRILAFDIETTKAPLKFPDATSDMVYLISYIIDGHGFLIVNREVMPTDIHDFEFTPKQEYETHFRVFNEPNEQATLVKFFKHVQEAKPFIFSTYNGDNFDWEFIANRAKRYGLDILNEIGVYKQNQVGYSGRFSVHMDCFCWVDRDAYLPQGSHGLKAVTRAKLGYEPEEIEPEQMAECTANNPQKMASYSASDAVATYFLYKKMIHDFIFALCTIIPTDPDEVLRKGSGTLCENLLMAEAFRCAVVFPNKERMEFEKFYKGHLIENETYIGGHVEAIRTGVYRNDLKYPFKLKKETYQMLIDEVNDIVNFAIEVEQKKSPEDCTNKEEVMLEIRQKLEFLKEAANDVLETNPIIYHLDVAAMYPNIILTNRLQPTAIVNENDCAGCLFNTEDSNCKRYLAWQWRGEYYCLNKSEYETIKRMLQEQDFDKEGVKINYMQLPLIEQQALIKKQVKEYCRKTYKNVLKVKTVERNDVLCMRENPFYVNTVRNFRDRRYEYKELAKVWKGKYNEAVKAKDILKAEDAENRASLYESLQLAHKIILNSFYGYVMRRGARWHCMEMAAMVTQIGGNIITNSRQLVEEIGMALELDTDGIWCLLPSGFPEAIKMTFKNGKSANLFFPCSVLNRNIYSKYCNPQYQTLEDQKSLTYKTHTEMSVFFEIDGPYRCMVLPASREENKMLKKRYAVFHLNGKIAELKGFEIKRRGELKLVQIFQSEVFEKFLKGTNLFECYSECAAVAEQWYSIIDHKGAQLTDEEIIEYISENKMLSKQIDDYGKQKSTSITCGRRMQEFLGSDITKGTGLNTRFIISSMPKDKTTTERAIPVSIFSVDIVTQQKYLRKWLGNEAGNDLSMKSIIDWDYYKERLTNTIQKIILIPAAMQNIPNLLPQIPLPDWLNKKIKERKYTQLSLQSFLTAAPKDIEEAAPIYRDKELEKSKLETEQLHNEIKECLSKCPSPKADYQQWLIYQKRLWVAQRKQRSMTSFKNTKKGGLYSYLNFDEETLRKSLWHILQINESQTPGYLKVWFIAESTDKSQNKCFSMFNLTLHIQRKLYINSKIENPNYHLSRKTLPRGKMRHHLYEAQIEEEDYLKTQLATQMYSYLCDPNIEGIYETKVSLVFRALLQLSAKVRPKKANYTLDHSQISTIFEIDDLDTFVLADTQYIPNGCFEQIYCSHLSIHDINFWATVSFSFKQIFIYVSCEKGKISDSESLPTLLKQIISTDAKSFDISSWQMKVEQESSFEDAIASINSGLIQLKQKLKDQRRCALVIIQSSLANSELIALGLEAAHSEFPVLRIPVYLPSREFVPVNWANDCAKIFAQRIQEYPDIINDRISLARSANLPLCNMALDAPLYLIDFLFAKKLYHLDNILWYSEEGRPDMGGMQDPFNIRHLDEEIENPEIINSGYYRTYSVELKIMHLAINAILKSGLLKAYDTEATQTVNDTNERNEFTLCRDAFSELKGMMYFWLQQIKKGNMYADMLMQHVYRWITCEQSYMYDPLLHRVVHKLTKTFFYLLIRKLTDMGARIVSANFHSIIIAINKYSYSEAKSYTSFLLKTIKENEFFDTLFVEEVRYWKILLFKDGFNSAGILEEAPHKITSNWHIVEFLPKAIEGMVLDNVAEFISRTHSKICKRVQEKKNLLFEEAAQEEIADMIEIMKDLSMAIFENVDRIKKRRAWEEEQSDLWIFPTKISAFQEMSSHTLEYVKIICQILSLESDFAETTIILRRNLLNILDIGEFSDDAKFFSPSLSLVLADVICDYCLTINDLDICREECTENTWRCSTCGHLLNKQMIEERLVELIKRRIICYHIQDLKCQKCKLVSNMLLQSNCECVGKLSLTCPDECEYSGANLVKANTPFVMLLGYLMDLSEENKMEYLQSIVKQIIE